MRRLAVILVLFLALAVLFDALVLATPKIQPGILAGERDTFFDRHHMNSTIAEERFVSAALNEERAYLLYLPEKYTSPANTLYLFHGRFGNHTTWTGKGDLKNTLDDMIAEKEIEPLVVIMPDCSGPDPEDYVCFDTSAYLAEIMAAAEQTHPAKNRAIGGMSYGAKVAVEIVMESDAFVSAAAQSGSYRRAIDLIGSGARPAARIYLDHGEFDYTPGFAKAETERLSAALAAHNISYTVRFYGNTPLDGGHTWIYWKDHIRDALRFHDAVFRQVI